MPLQIVGDLLGKTLNKSDKHQYVADSPLDDLG